MPTIFDSEESHFSAGSKFLKSLIPIPKKSPTKRVYQQDPFKLFEEQDKIKVCFDDIDSTLTPPGYTFQKYDDHIVFYHLETNVLNVPVCVCELIVTSMLSCFTRVHLYLYQNGFVMEGTVALREKLSKLYQIRGRGNVQYSGRA